MNPATAQSPQKNSTEKISASDLHLLNDLHAALQK